MILSIYGHCRRSITRDSAFVGNMRVGSEAAQCTGHSRTPGADAAVAVGIGTRVGTNALLQGHFDRKQQKAAKVAGKQFNFWQ